MSALLSIARLWLGGLSLPFDRDVAGVILLMWPRPGLGQWVIEIALRLIDLVSFSLPLLLGLGALLIGRRHRLPAVIRLAYQSALAVPVLAFVVGDMHRWVANAVYLASARVSADYTPVLTRFEGSVLARLQTGLVTDTLSRICGVIYSSGWLVALLLAVPLLAALNRPRAVNDLLVGWVIAPLVALPFFVLFPIYEPWVLNPLYGYSGPGQTAVLFLSADRSAVDLSQIIVQVHWATAACLPSLHVALPALVSRVAYRHRAHWVGRAYAVLAGVIAFTVVYLGRHWILDAAAAVPFAMLVAWMAGRLHLPLLLPSPETLAATKLSGVVV